MEDYALGFFLAFLIGFVLVLVLEDRKRPNKLYFQEEEHMFSDWLTRMRVSPVMTYTWFFLYVVLFLEFPIYSFCASAMMGLYRLIKVNLND